MFSAYPESDDRGKSWTTYDTASYPASECFGFWQDVICSVLSPSENSSVSGETPFAARLHCVPVGNLEISRLMSSPINSIRNSRLLRSKPNEDFFVGFMVSGSGTLIQDNRTALPQDGDVVLYDSARPFGWHLHGDYDIIVARIPRRVLLARLPDAERLTARVASANQPFAALIGNSMREILNMRDLPNVIGSQRLATSLVDILSVSLEFSLRPRVATVAHDDLLARAKQYLLDNLEDPELDFAKLTTATGVSPRTLCRVFAADGTTAMRWLWQKRIEFAHKILSEGRVTSVSQAVMMSGFNDFSHFGRAFKKAYGYLPRSLLHANVSA